ncbi:MAG: ribokinase [Armatimonadetes bacterium]|nr:ribokinase [Armatimonadota bacterium]
MGVPVRIVVVGSTNTDMVAKAERLPRPGETVIGGSFVTVAGGKGANQAVAAARLGARVSFVGAVGDDALGAEAVAGLAAEGIDVSHVVMLPGHASGVALILVDAAGQNSIMVAPGANMALTPDHVDRAVDAVAAADVLVLQCETPLATVQRAAALARSHGVRVILNPAPAQSVPVALLQSVDLLTPNESEADALLGEPGAAEADPERAAAALADLAGCPVIVTLGVQGAVACRGSDITRIAPRRVDAVDATAAGDCFTGALAVGLAEGLSLLDAAAQATLAASISVTRLGAQRSLPTRAELSVST